MTCPDLQEFQTEIAAGQVRTLGLNLLPLNQGYTLTIPGRNCSDCTTEVFPYSEHELLDCVQRREIPWFLSDLLEHCPSRLFYKGCLAIQLCDYRNPVEQDESWISIPQSTMIVLRPSALSLTNDLNVLLESNPGLNRQQKLELEAKFWLMVAPPFDFKVPTRLDSLQTRMDSVKFRKLRRPYEPRRLVRRSAENDCQLKRLRLTSEIISNVNKYNKPTLLEQFKLLSTTTKPAPSTGGQWRPMVPAAKTADELAARKHAIQEQKRRDRYPNEHPADHLQLIEEITVEMAAGIVQEPASQVPPELVHTTRIVISKNKRDGTYWGFLCLEGTPSVENGPFQVGVEWDAKMYVLQYLEMITEGGRKQPISVTRNSPGKPPHVVTGKLFKQN